MNDQHNINYMTTKVPDIFEVNVPQVEPERQYFFMDHLKSWIASESLRLMRPLTYHVQTFGCQMNAKDSEKLAGILETVGYIEIEEEDADFVIYNTCTVRENANSKVYGRIGLLGTLKEKNRNMKIALCGCMMQEQQAVDKIRQSYRFVDIIFGTHNIYKLAELLYKNILSGKHVTDIQDKSDLIVEDLPSNRKYSFKAGVNIMYGCNNFCSYCIVPYVRGRERSRTPEDILKEVEELVENGVIEIMLLGQNVNSYGKTLPEPIAFAQLLEKIEKIEKLKRIRFMTPHPKDLSDELIEVIRTSNKICKHIHLPIQSGSSRILKLMNRHYTKEDYLALVNRIKEAIPDIAITTDMIVGFPGETDEDILDTIDVVNQVGFTSAYTYQYSKRSGTAAADMPDQGLPQDVNRRFSMLLSVVQKQTQLQAQKLTGTIQEVLIEEENEQVKGLLTGRLSSNLLVHFKGDRTDIGQIKKVLLEECKGFYFIGVIIS